MWVWLAGAGVCQGVFALFTMYLPPLFPTLLRTTGAGFSFNIGRLAAAFGTVYFGTFSQGGRLSARALLLGVSVHSGGGVCAAVAGVAADARNGRAVE